MVAETGPRRAPWPPWPKPLLADLPRLIVGAGQAGLGTGYWLARRTSLSFLIIDGDERIGDSWRRRWDSLVLFTPRRFSSLPGTRMRGPGEYAKKDETGLTEGLEHLASRGSGCPFLYRPRTLLWRAQDLLDAARTARA